MNDLNLWKTIQVSFIIVIYFQNIKHISLAMSLSVNALINQIAFNYVTSNYSTNVSFKVSTVADIAFRAPWYQFPISQQKLFGLIIQQSQKSIQLTGYGIITCSMETFLKVCIDCKFILIISLIRLLL